MRDDVHDAIEAARGDYVGDDPSRHFSQKVLRRISHERLAHMVRQVLENLPDDIIFISELRDELDNGNNQS